MALSRIESIKIKAKLLQKAKRKNDPTFPLKVAYEMIAKGAGYESWRAMKEDVEQHERFRPVGSSAFWCIWYHTYEEAINHLQENGGYLVPYQKQFFICDRHYLAFLGLSDDDPDLALLGNDLARPRHREAYTRLLAKIGRGGSNHG